MEVMASHARNMDKKVFWDIYGRHLQEAAERAGKYSNSGDFVIDFIKYTHQVIYWMREKWSDINLLCSKSV